jgi:murein DD-endopeptidase MepM/ murein hydrolase activator NlpD
MNRKKGKSVPRFSLRERLERAGRERAPVSDQAADCRRLQWESIPGQWLRPLHEHLFEKTVAATLAVIFFGLFSLLDFPLTNRITDTARYLTVHQTDPRGLLEQAEPVVKAFREFDRQRRPEAAGEAPVPETMAAPVSGVLVKPYGAEFAVSGETPEMNYGIDVAAPAGSPVYAALSGTVTLVREHPDFGLTIYLEHAGGLKTIYSRLEGAEVAAGDSVRRGERLAVIAKQQAGQETLHFQVWQDGRPVDPQQFIVSLE